MLGMGPPRDDVRELNDRVRPAGEALDQTGVELATSQRFFLQALTSTSETRSAVIAQAESAGNRANAVWRQYERVAYGSAGELRLQRAYDTSVTAGQSLGATVFGLIASPDQIAYNAALSKEEVQSNKTSAILQQIESKNSTPQIRTCCSTQVAPSLHFDSGS